jgi:hypothetical protein
VAERGADGLGKRALPGRDEAGACPCRPGANRRLFITLFDSREAIEAAESRFEQMGDEIPRMGAADKRRLRCTRSRSMKTARRPVRRVSACSRDRQSRSTRALAVARSRSCPARATCRPGRASVARRPRAGPGKTAHVLGERGGDAGQRAGGNEAAPAVGRGIRRSGPRRPALRPRLHQTLLAQRTSQRQLCAVPTKIRSQPTYLGSSGRGRQPPMCRRRGPAAIRKEPNRHLPERASTRRVTPHAPVALKFAVHASSFRR